MNMEILYKSITRPGEFYKLIDEMYANRLPTSVFAMWLRQKDDEDLELIRRDDDLLSPYLDEVKKEIYRRRKERK